MLTWFLLGRGVARPGIRRGAVFRLVSEGFSVLWADEFSFAEFDDLDSYVSEMIEWSMSRTIPCLFPMRSLGSLSTFSGHVWLFSDSFVIELFSIFSYADLEERVKFVSVKAARSSRPWRGSRSRRLWRWARSSWSWIGATISAAAFDHDQIALAAATGMIYGVTGLRLQPRDHTLQDCTGTAVP